MTNEQLSVLMTEQGERLRLVVEKLQTELYEYAEKHKIIPTLEEERNGIDRPGTRDRFAYFLGDLQSMVDSYRNQAIMLAEG